jgi:hypothetical protein
MDAAGMKLDKKPVHIPGTTVRMRRDHNRWETYVNISIPIGYDGSDETRRTAFSYSALLAIAIDEVQPGGLLHDKWKAARAKARMLGEYDGTEEEARWI